MKKTYSFVITLLMLSSTNAQQLDITNAKFTTENKMEFINPSYDDSKWGEIKTGMNYEVQGYDGYNGYSWYRIRTNISYTLKEKSLWKDSLKLNFGCIDDCDEIYLNGKLISKSGSFPEDSAGYITTWNKLQDIHLAVNNPLIYWGKENVIAIKVYDGNGGGGMFKNAAFIKMVDILDNVKLDFIPQKNGELQIKIENENDKTINGFISYKKNNSTTKVDLAKQNIEKNSFGLDNILINDKNENCRSILVSFIETLAGTSITKKYFVPYILTPVASKNISINTPSEYGVKPNHPILYKIPVSGLQPIKYLITNLPKSLKLDAATGIITGMLSDLQQVNLKIIASNSIGLETKNMILKCGNKISLTPPMGWSSWNCWGIAIDDAKVRAAAKGMVEKGLVNYGYNTVNIDDGWESQTRNTNGAITGNDKFPNMKSLGDYIHDYGIKYGIYSSPGDQTCGGYLGSLNHELQDAQTYNSWGVDYLKYDWCSYDFNFAAAKDTSLAAYKKPYMVMQAALDKQPRDIVYSLCQYGMKNVWEWGASVGGNLWRTTGDMEDTWASFSGIGFTQTKQQQYAKPGHWNDADMMVLGNVGWGPELHPSKLTPDEQYTHMSLWCLLNNPLLLGCDITTMDDFTLNLLTNTEVLAIDQNTFAAPASPIVKNEVSQIWLKKLSNNSYAIGIFNMSETETNIAFKWSELKLATPKKVRDTWRQKDEIKLPNMYNTIVAAHGVKLIVVTQ